MLWEIGSLLQYNLTHQSLPGYCALFEEDSAENGDLSMGIQAEGRLSRNAI